MQAAASPKPGEKVKALNAFLDVPWAELDNLTCNKLMAAYGKTRDYFLGSENVRRARSDLAINPRELDRALDRLKQRLGAAVGK